MAIYAKLPFALAPGMGLNAFFCYTVCLGMGYSWQFALTAVLIEGIIFVLLTLTSVREAIVDALPLSLRKAIGAGIGLFIALIGLESGGIVVSDPATLVTLGDITHGVGLLSVIGLLLTGILVILKVPGSLLIGILGTALIGVPMGITKFTGRGVPSISLFSANLISARSESGHADRRVHLPVCGHLRRSAL